MKTKAGWGVGVFLSASLLCVGLALIGPPRAEAHCDTLDGPVVTDAKAALGSRDLTPVLKWVKKEHEGEVREAFEKALEVRAKGPAARKLADRYFFETLVRVHRAGEGAPYTGLKPAGTDPGVAIREADKALASGSVDPVVEMVAGEVATGVRERFAHALEAKRHADESVEAGREFVEAYVVFIHYVEHLHDAASGPAGGLH